MTKALPSAFRPRKICSTCKFDSSQIEQKKGIWCKSTKDGRKITDAEPGNNQNGDCKHWQLVPGYKTLMIEESVYSVGCDGKVPSRKG